MNNKELINRIGLEQKELNSLFIQARNQDLKIDISINKAECFEGDTAEVIGLRISDNSPVYSDDGCN